MAIMSPQEVAQKQADRLKQSIPDIRRGIERVTEAPGIKAAAAADKMLAKVTEAIKSGKYADNVKAVSLEEWKSKALNKGVDRIASGIDNAQKKTVAFFTQLGEHQKQNQSALDKMPTTTLQDSQNKMIANMVHMSKMKFDKSKI